MDAGTAWRLLRKFWVDVYARAPDYISTDAGTNLNSAGFKDRALLMGSIVKIVPTEAHERIGLVERSHAVLRKIYEKLRIDLPHINCDDRLSMAFRAINDAPNSDTGISPTTLVFGVYPKIHGGGLRGTMLQRASIIRDCTNNVTKMKARRTLRDAVMLRNTASCLEMQKVSQLPPGHNVLVFRENEGWKRYTMVRVRDHEVDVVLSSGRISTFGLNCVRPYYEKDDVTESHVDTANDVLAVKKNSTLSDQTRMMTRSRTKRVSEMTNFHGKIDNFPDKDFYCDSRL